MAAGKVFIVVLLILILAFHLTSSSEWMTLKVPEHFTDKNISNYTVRYVSPLGTDSPACLASQPYNLSGGCEPRAAGDEAITYCRTVGYSIVGECLGSSYYVCRPLVHHNLIVIVAGSVMVTDNRTTLQAFNFVNFMLARVPECDKEFVVSCIRYSEVTFTDLYMQDSRNVAVDGLTFAFCGPLSNGIAFRNVYNNFVTNSVFRNNWNSGIANYNPHNASFINCTFRDNYSIQRYSESVTLNPGQYRYAGGLNLLWNGQSIKQVNILVRNCTFINNTAGINKWNENDTRPNLYIPRGQGGAILAAFNGTQNHNITIEDSLIIDNTAKFNGGGMFLSFYGGSNNNYIEIRNTKFLNNRCNQAGGALSMFTFEVANQNYLRIRDTEFYQNSAVVGGGAFTINLQDNQISAISNSKFLVENIGIFENCSFVENRSPTGGSAVGLTTNTRVDQVIKTTNFTNCKFINNYARVDREGALMAFRYPISLLGTILFKGNQGGGVTLLQSYLDNHGSVWFESNYAMNGGGMEMRDFSFIQMLRGSSMTFINNEAVNRGGGLAVSSASSVATDTDIIRLFNTRCFIQHDLSFGSSYPPESWNISMKFINNTAGKDGGAIYSTAIQSCLYTTTLEETSVIYDSSIFKLSQFSFINNSVKEISASRTNHEFGTAPSFIRVEPESITGAPGEILSFDISALDEAGNWKEAVWNYIDYSKENNETSSDSFLSLRAGVETHIYPVKKLGPSENCSSMPKITRVITFSIVQILSGSVVNQTNVTVNVVCCYPGYKEVDGMCELSRNTPILRADSNNHYVYIQPQFYAEYENNAFIHAIVPIPFHRCNTKQSSLTGCLVKYDDPYEQCQENRTGFLCGKCPEGKGVDLTLRQCRDCNVRDTILVILIIIIFAIMCALILIFNVRVPNELRGCLFFVQVVGFIYIYADGEHVSWDFHISRVFGTSLYLTLCPLPGTKALFTASYGLILPILGIIVISVYVISARFLRHLSNKNSLDGIWFLSFIIYKFIADTSFTILRCQKVIGSNRFVFYYDGSNQCFSTSDLEHLSFAILALFLGFLVILFPIFILLISFGRFNLSIQFTDVLNKDLNLSCRWWASFDLFRRLLFFIIVLLFNYVAPSYAQLALFYAGLAVFFVAACAKPYKSMLANVMESVVLLDLIIITGFFLNTSKKNLHGVRGLASVLLLFPFLTIAIYYIIRIWSFCWNKWCPSTVKDYSLTGILWIKQHATRVLTFDNLASYQEESLKTELLMTSTSSSSGKKTEADISDTVDVSDVGYSELREELLD